LLPLATTITETMITPVRIKRYTQEALAASAYVRALVKLLKPTLDEIA